MKTSEIERLANIGVTDRMMQDTVLGLIKGKVGEEFDEEVYKSYLKSADRRLPIYDFFRRRKENGVKASIEFEFIDYYGVKKSAGC